jgi:Flp pilus assembly protein CpaB
MRLQLPRGLDLASGALIASGVVLVAAAIVAAVVYVTPPSSIAASAPEPGLVAPEDPGRPSETLAADRVAAVLFVDAANGAGGAAHPGDRVDVLGYFSRKVTGDQSVTRVLLQDVPVLASSRSGASVALTLAVPHESAVLLQEAQAIGARPLVTLRAAQSTLDASAPDLSFSDADLANRVAGAR